MNNNNNSVFGWRNNKYNATRRLFLENYSPTDSYVEQLVQTRLCFLCT